ncbi:MAG: ABC transporter permease [Bacteroidetes bacterium]|nr:MAG: ABC transporter permease [Bacteroidota bacterium]
MNKIILIIKREYLYRVKKKTFIIMTLIGPVLFAALMILPAWIAQLEDTEEKTIAVIDNSQIFDKTKFTKTAVNIVIEKHRKSINKIISNEKLGTKNVINSIIDNSKKSINSVFDNNTIIDKTKINNLLDSTQTSISQIISNRKTAHSLDTTFQHQKFTVNLILSRSSHLKKKLADTDYLKFKFINSSYEKAKTDFVESGYFGLLLIPENVLKSNKVQYYSEKDITLGIKSHISNSIEKEIERQKFKSEGIDENVLKSIKTNINVQSIKWTEDGEEKGNGPEIKMIIGYLNGFLIYLFIFMFGAQVMRGVIEEKTSRIIEVIISSVKPFQLMMGKIIGIAFVGLTQFLLWVILTIMIITGVKSAVFPEKDASQIKAQTELISTAGSMQNIQGIDAVDAEQSMSEIENIFGSIENINFGIILGSFLFFFIGGYLLYAALFAAIGSAVDSEADTQQFMLPITIPLILAIIVMMNAIQTPDSPIAFWFSIIPFTSPVIMMVRIPFGVPYWQLFLSMGLLIITFIGATWVAAKIYRTGILMYGKKTTYKELWKWLRYKS